MIITSFKQMDGYGHIQRAAVLSWQKFAPSKIIAIGDHEQGVPEFCAELGVQIIPTKQAKTDLDITDFKEARYGAPLLDYIVALGEENAQDGEVVCLTNADIIFTKPIGPIVELFAKHADPLCAARRFGIHVPDEAGPAAGLPEAPNGSDTFFWKKGFFRRAGVAIPPFIMGRPAWDNWMMGIALSNAKPPVDVTELLHGCHPHHGYRKDQTNAGCDYNRALTHYSGWRTLLDDGWLRLKDIG